MNALLRPSGSVQGAFSRHPLLLEDLPPVDVILISHDHYDHLGAGTVERLTRMASLGQTHWITSLGVGTILSSLGVAPARLTELDWTEQVQVGSLTITAVTGPPLLWPQPLQSVRDAVVLIRSYRPEAPRLLRR